jgi:hypothetical protein
VKRLIEVTRSGLDIKTQVRYSAKSTVFEDTARALQSATTKRLTPRTRHKCTVQIRQERNEFDIAKQTFEKVLTTGRAALGKFYPEVASILNKIRKLSYELGDMILVMSYYKEGLKVERAVLKPDHPHIMVILANIAQIHKQRGNYVAAVRKYHEVHMMQVRISGPNHIDIAATLSRMGLI